METTLAVDSATLTGGIYGNSGEMYGLSLGGNIYGNR